MRGHGALVVLASLALYPSLFSQTNPTAPSGAPSTAVSASDTPPVRRGVLGPHILSPGFTSLFNTHFDQPKSAADDRKEVANAFLEAVQGIAAEFGGGAGAQGAGGLPRENDICINNPQHAGIAEAAAKAKAAIAANDNATALCWAGIAARLGDASSQRLYANAFFHMKDYPHAALYFELAARQGDAKAAQDLAVLYSRGLGVPQDKNKADYWSSLPKPQVNTPCDENNPTHLSGDEAVKLAIAAARKDQWKEGLCWLWIGSSQGNAKALFLLGLVQMGDGHEDAALDMFNDAARQGEVCSQAMMMVAYREVSLSPDSSQPANSWRDQVLQHPGGSKLIAQYMDNERQYEADSRAFDDRAAERSRREQWNKQADAAVGPLNHRTKVDLGPDPGPRPERKPLVLPGCMPSDIRDPVLSAL